MKYYLLFFFLLSFHLSAFCQADNPKYDKALADSLGGDDHGMKGYILVILKSGTNTAMAKSVADSLFAGHIANIVRLAGLRKLVVSGPIGKNDKAYRGIFILNVKTVEEARILLEPDPAIKEKLLEVEMFKWYGSAALPEYLEFHEKIEKKKM